MIWSKIATASFAAAALLVGCKRWRSVPPFEKFVRPEYRSPVTGKVYRPPDAALKSWKVLALQTEPRPVENPHWTVVGLSDSGELSMPHGSAFRCIYNPTKFRAAEDEPPKDIDGWELLREVRCSQDGFRTWIGAGVKILYEQQGTVRARSGERAELELSEVIGGRSTRISILLRPEGAG